MLRLVDKNYEPVKIHWVESYLQPHGLTNELSS